MQLVAHHEILRTAVAYILLASGLDGITCTFERLIKPLVFLGSCDGSDDFLPDVTVSLLQSAFKDKDAVKEQHVLPYSFLLGEDTILSDADEQVHYLLVRVGVPGAGRGEKYNEVARVSVNVDRRGNWQPVTAASHDVLPRGGQHDDLEEHPIRLEPSILRQADMAFYTELARRVPPDVKRELRKYLQEIRRKRTEQAEKDRKKQEAEAAKQYAKEAREANRKRAATQTPADPREEGAETPPDAAPAQKKGPIAALINLVTNPSGGKKGPGRKPKRKRKKQDTSVDVEAALAMESKIIADIKTFQQFKAQIKQQALAADPAADVFEDEEISATFTLDGRAGQRRIADRFVLVEDLKSNLIEIPQELDTKENQQIRSSRGTELARYGASEVLIPVGTALVGKNYLTKLKKWAKIIKRLLDLFDGDRCAFSRQALIIMAIGGLHNYGGSDESFQVVLACFCKALFFDIGLEVSHSHLGRAIPARRTIARYEMRFATDCLMLKLWEMQQDGATVVGVITDHGHRGSQDHFVIVVIWSGFDRNGKMTLKSFCPSIDSAGHSGEEAAEGVKLVIRRFLGDGVTIKMGCITGDTGGGGAVQTIAPLLKENGALDKDGEYGNCALHAMQKAIETSSIETMGDQGQGARSPSQMVFVFGRMMKTLRDLGGAKFVDEIWETVRREMLKNDRWRAYAEKNMGMAWKEFVHACENFDEDSLEEMANLEKFIMESPRGIQEPVWTRWQSMIKIIAIFLDNYSSIYFLAVTIKTHYKHERYLCKYACSLISLMNERAKPALDSEAINSFIDGQNPDDTEGDGEYELPVASPTFYTMLLWHRAFTDHVFNDSWRFLLQNDPYFGPGTFGQCARFMAERAAVIKQRLDELKDGGWQNIPAFAKYKEAVDRVPEVTENPAYVNRGFFLEEMPKQFVSIFEASLQKHIYETWLSENLVWYMIGGDPVLAQVFCQMLVHYKSEYARISENEDGEEINNTVQPFIYSPSLPTSLELGEHHTMFEEDAAPLVVNVQTTMDFLASNVKFEKLLKKRFITKPANWAFIEQLALAEETVRLWDRNLDGTIDSSTWAGVNYKPLIEAIWRTIAIHSHHQQRCENYVQMAALIAKTRVGEKRRTWRGIGLSAFTRPFNIWAVEKRRDEEPDEAKKKKIIRVEGRHRIELLSEYIDMFMADCKSARAATTDAQYKKLRESIESKEMKASAKEKKKLVDGIKHSLATKDSLKTYAAEKTTGYEKTARMKGRVYLKQLTKTKGVLGQGWEPEVNAEIVARGIMQTKEFLDEYGEEADLEEIPFLAKKKLLKTDQARRDMMLNRSLTFEDAFKKTNAIYPETAAIRRILEESGEPVEGEE